MPKNIKGGNKAKKGKNIKKGKPLVISSTDTKYAAVVGNLGNGRCHLKIIGKLGVEYEAQGYIRGCVRRAKFNKDDIVLCSLRDLGTYKSIKEVDIIFKYTLDDYNQLVNMGEIKSLSDIENGDCGIDFLDDEETNTVIDDTNTQLDDFKFEDI